MDMRRLVSKFGADLCGSGIRSLVCKDGLNSRHGAELHGQTLISGCI